MTDKYKDIPFQSKKKLAGLEGLSSQLTKTGVDLEERGINVTSKGLKGDNGITDNTTLLSAALDYAIANKSELFLPEGIYVIKAPITKTISKKFKIRGDNAVIKLVLPNGTPNTLSVLRFNDVKKNITFEGITIDANRQASNPLIIHNNSTDMVNVGNVVFQDCVFQNGLQTDDTLYQSGVYVRGAFNKVISNRSTFINMDSTKTTSPVSRGLHVAEDSDKDNYTKSVVITDSHFEDIYNYTTVDSDGFSYSNKFDPLQLKEGNLSIKGTTFKNCKGRSIKSQVQSDTIVGNYFYRDKYAGNTEVDCQYAGATISNNQFFYKDFGVDVVFGGSVRSAIHRQFVAADNVVTVINATITSVCGIDAMGNFPLNSVSIKDNKVKGIVQRFAKLRIADVADNTVDIIGNSAETATSFLNVWMYGTGAPVLKGAFQSNLELGTAKPFELTSTTFKPTVFLNNTRINIAQGAMLSSDDQALELSRFGTYIRRLYQGNRAMNTVLSINVPWENKRSAVKVMCSTAYASDTEVTTYISTLECWVTMGLNGVAKVSPVANTSPFLGDWDVVANGDKSGLTITKTAGSTSAYCNYFVVVEGNDQP